MTTGSLSSRLPVLSRVSVVLVMLAVLAAMVSAKALRPLSAPSASVPSLELMLPKSFGDWREEPSPLIPVPLADDDKYDVQRSAFDQSLMRTYVNSRGDRVMLAVAYIGQQAQESKIHRPELCYVGQGFQTGDLVPTRFPVRDGVSAHPVSGKRMRAVARARVELVSYWIRIGSIYSESGWETRSFILREGLRGRTVDGALVRVSQIVPPSMSAAAQGSAYRVQEQFAADLAAAMPVDGQRLLVR